MLSTRIRLQVEAICKKIELKQEVSLADRVWIQKWAEVNRTVASMLRTAHRRAINGTHSQESLDGFMDIMDLGDPDPSNHRASFDGPDDLANWFQAPPWMKRD